jgi:hypothetical protein
MKRKHVQYMDTMTTLKEFYSSLKTTQVSTEQSYFRVEEIGILTCNNTVYETLLIVRILTQCTNGSDLSM